MKCFYVLFSTILLVQGMLAQERTDLLLKRLSDRDQEYVFVVAHRGDWRNAPENSLVALENAIRMGVDMVEIDIQRTQDGQLILMHDKTLDRTTTGKGNVSDWSLDSIHTLRLKNGCAIRTKHKVPTLEEAMLLCKNRVLVNLDKAYSYFDEVYEILEKTGTTRQVIIKGNKPVEEVQKEFGTYLAKVIYMPVVNLDQKEALTIIRNFSQQLRPVAYELVYAEPSNPLPPQFPELLNGESLIWYNTLWDTLAGGHDDDLALEDPDLGYGYLIHTLGARIIQTDRPAYLLDYLRKKGLHD